MFDLNDQNIQALVDNELDWEQEKEVRRHIENDAKSRNRYLELIKQKQLLKKYWQFLSS